MKFFCSPRQLSQLQFAATSQREALSEDAEVFAVRDGTITIRQQDAEALSPVTDQEQSDLQDHFSQSGQAEVASTRCIKICGPNPLRGILQRLISL